MNQSYFIESLLCSKHCVKSIIFLILDLEACQKQLKPDVMNAVMEVYIKIYGNREGDIVTSEGGARASGSSDYSSIPKCKGLRLIGGLGLGQRAQ